MVLISLPQNLYCLVNCPPDNQPTFKLILHRNQPRYPHLSIHLSIYLSILHLSSYLSISISIYPFYLSSYQSISIHISSFLSTYLSISIYPPISPISICPPIVLSIHIYPIVYLFFFPPDNQPTNLHSNSLRNQSRYLYLCIHLFYLSIFLSSCIPISSLSL